MVIAVVHWSTLKVKTGYGYSPFGVVTKFNSATPSTNTMQYGGHENDGTGLYYYRARYYSPVLQRYISEDPIGFGGGDTNLYRYVGNNPHVGSDATGLCGIEYGGSCDEISDGLVYESGGYRGGRPPYKGYRPEGFTLSLAAGGPLVAAVPAAIPVLAGGVEALIFGLGVTVKFLRGGLFSTPGPGPQPALDGSVFGAEESSSIFDELKGTLKGNGDTEVEGGRAKAKQIFRDFVPKEGRERITDKSSKAGQRLGKGIAGRLNDGTSIRIRFKRDGTTRLQVGKRKFIFE